MEIIATVVENVLWLSELLHMTQHSGITCPIAKTLSVELIVKKFCSYVEPVQYLSTVHTVIFHPEKLLFVVRTVSFFQLMHYFLSVTDTS